MSLTVFLPILKWVGLSFCLEMISVSQIKKIFHSMGKVLVQSIVSKFFTNCENKGERGLVNAKDMGNVLRHGGVS